MIGIQYLVTISRAMRIAWLFIFILYKSVKILYTALFDIELHLFIYQMVTWFGTPDVIIWYEHE